MLKLVKIQSLRKIGFIYYIAEVRNFNKRLTIYNIHFLVKFQNSKVSHFSNIKPIFLKLWILTNFNTLFPVVVLYLVFDDFSPETIFDNRNCTSYY
jgi:hypothetical protein